MMVYYKLNPLEHIWVKFESHYNDIYVKEIRLNVVGNNVGHFASTWMCSSVLKLFSFGIIWLKDLQQRHID